MRVCLKMVGFGFFFLFVEGVFLNTVSETKTTLFNFVSTDYA